MNRMLPTSPYLWGTNLVTMDGRDRFLTDPTAQEQIHVRMIRFPRRYDPSVYRAAAECIRQLGMLPLALTGLAEAFRDSFEFYSSSASSFQ